MVKTLGANLLEIFSGFLPCVQLFMVNFSLHKGTPNLRPGSFPGRTNSQLRSPLLGIHTAFPSPTYFEARLSALTAGP